MAKTSKQIQGDIYQLLRDSTLYTMISGEVYRAGMRPRDSQQEDAVVIFTAGIPSQIQTGVVTVNVFVPDVDPYNNGVLVEDSERTEKIESLAQAWVDSLTAEVSNYKFRLQQTIYTEYEQEIKQHFVVVKLAYEYYGCDDAPLNIPQEAFIDALDEDGQEGYLPLLITEDGEDVEVLPVNEKKEKSLTNKIQ